MALINLRFFSEALGMNTEAIVIMPQRGNYGEIGIDANVKPGPYKCLYLLHGLSDDHTIWLRRTSIERYAAAYGICVVMPKADRSFYTDMKYGMAYYTHIAKELPKVVREFFNVSDKREDNFIAGLSMGGYGALKIGLRECESFSAAVGLSPCGDIKNVGFEDVMRPIFGEELCVPDEDCLLCLADAKRNDPNRPRIFIAIGTEDFLYDNIKPLREKLSQDYDYTYMEGPGGHSWDFWDEYIRHALWWMLNPKK